MADNRNRQKQFVLGSILSTHNKIRWNTKQSFGGSIIAMGALDEDLQPVNIAWIKSANWNSVFLYFMFWWSSSKFYIFQAKLIIPWKGFWQLPKGFWDWTWYQMKEESLPFCCTLIRPRHYSSVPGNRIAVSRDWGFTSIICWMHRNNTEYIFLMYNSHIDCKNQMSRTNVIVALSIEGQIQ